MAALLLGPLRVGPVPSGARRWQEVASPKNEDTITPISPNAKPIVNGYNPGTLMPYAYRMSRCSRGRPHPISL
jgi:hypothetical protein